MNLGSGNTAAQQNLVPGLFWVVRPPTSDFLIPNKNSINLSFLYQQGVTWNLHSSLNLQS